MTTEANAYPALQPEPLPPPHPQPPRRGRRALFITIGAVVTAAVAALLVVMFTASGTTSVNGTLSLLCDVKCTRATANGYDGYRDLSEGSQVTLVDESGQVVATTELHRAPGEATKVVGAMWVRTFTFTFPDVPSADRYGVHVGNSNRGTLWKNADETEREGFQLTIGG